jgi:hypothetical protein
MSAAACHRLCVLARRSPLGDAGRPHREGLARRCSRRAGHLGNSLGARDRTRRDLKGFWHACGAGQRRAAERLLNAGADLDWVPDYAEGTALDGGDGPVRRERCAARHWREL